MEKIKIGQKVGLPITAVGIDGWVVINHDPEAGWYLMVPADYMGPPASFDLAIADQEGDRLVLRGGFGVLMPEEKLTGLVDVEDVANAEHVAYMLRIMQGMLGSEPRVVRWRNDVTWDDPAFQGWEAYLQDAQDAAWTYAES